MWFSERDILRMPTESNYWDSSMSGDHSIAFGFSSVGRGNYSLVAGGYYNKALADSSIILGGSNNQVHGVNSVIVGGERNQISSSNSVILGGKQNRASMNAVILGYSKQILRRRQLFLVFKILSRVMTRLFLVEVIKH